MKSIKIAALVAIVVLTICKYNACRAMAVGKNAFSREYPFSLKPDSKVDYLDINRAYQ